MIKRKLLMLVVIVAFVVSCLTFTCYANEISITNVSFEKFTDEYGIENDANVVMKIEFVASANTTQISVCVLGEDIDDIVQAELTNKLVYMGQFNTPSSGVLMIPLSKAMISTATGNANVDGATIYLRVGGKTISDSTTMVINVAIPKSEEIPGDVDGDGEVTNRDVTLLLRYLAEWELSDISLTAMDVDGDDEITNRDGTLLLRYLAGWDVELV